MTIELIRSLSDEMVSMSRQETTKRLGMVINKLTIDREISVTVTLYNSVRLTRCHPVNSRPAKTLLSFVV